MKNLLIALIVIAAATVVYQQTQPRHDDTDRAKTVAADVPQTAPASGETAVELSAFISTAPENARVFIIEPKHGSVVSSPVMVKFGIENMVVAPAGDNQPDSGHHHLLINQAELPDMSKPLPATDTIIHFGKGQTETTIELAPGQHTLQLLLGNYLHIPHANPVISERITVTVE